MGRFIHDTCHKANDEDIVEQKAADTAILALVAMKGIKGAKVKWEKRVCPDRFGQVIVDCPEYGGRKTIDGFAYWAYAWARDIEMNWPN
ncbi:MAG: hypothetical protein L6R35_007609 [Caloplaca aegaea]|nr:MAG: hypothetical protein L6R35_007609 [Caloplaca aegaea]